MTTQSKSPLYGPPPGWYSSPYRDKRIDEVLGYLTHRVAAWLEYLQLIPQHAVGGFNTPPAGIVTLALWIVLQIPVHTDYRRPFPFAAPAHTPTMTSIQHILSTGFSGDSDVVLDATERLVRYLDDLLRMMTEGHLYCFLRCTDYTRPVIGTSHDTQSRLVARRSSARVVCS